MNVSVLLLGASTYDGVGGGLAKPGTSVMGVVPESGLGRWSTLGVGGGACATSSVSWITPRGIPNSVSVEGVPTASHNEHCASRIHTATHPKEIFYGVMEWQLHQIKRDAIGGVKFCFNRNISLQSIAKEN